MVISSSPASVSGRLWFDPQFHPQEAAATLARRPGAVLEGEARPFEQSLVDGAGNAAERGDFILVEPGLAPGVLERAAVQLDLQTFGIGAHHLRPEDLAPAGDVGQERRAQPGE